MGGRRARALSGPAWHQGRGPRASPPGISTSTHPPPRRTPTWLNSRSDPDHPKSTQNSPTLSASGPTCPGGPGGGGKRVYSRSAGGRQLTVAPQAR
jgi:hypothetical protein